MTFRSVGPRKMLRYLLDCVLSNFRSRAALQLEVIVLRHQLEVLQRTRPARVRLTRLDRIFWLFLYRLWPRCLDAVVIVKPETVIAWHRKGFRAFWAWKSRPRRRGRPPVPAEVRALIPRVTRKNPRGVGRGAHRASTANFSSLGSRSVRPLSPNT